MRGVAYLGDRRVEVREYPRPVPNAGEVLIEMRAAGLCGSDLHKYRKNAAWADARNGMIAGHEPSGVVSALGPGVTGIEVGDRVSVYHSLGCGRCGFCVSGTPVLCREEGAFGRTRDGCHADFMTAPARFCLPLPDDMSFALGAMLSCTAGTAFSAVQKLPILPGDIALVIGLGPVGLSVAMIAEAHGFRCIGADVNPIRLDLARKCLDGSVVDASEDRLVESVLEVTGGENISGIIECSGNASARTQTTQLIATRGTIVIVGAGSDSLNLDPDAIIRRELAIRGNAVYSMRQYYQTIDVLRNRRIDLESIVTHRVPIDEATTMFAQFDSGKTGKVVFEWPGS